MNFKQALIEMGVPEKTVNKFLSWHLENPTIWVEFEKAALELIAEGFTHWGAKALIEQVRFKTRHDYKGAFKINNNYPAYYARAFALKHPQHKDFFEFREIKGLNSKIEVLYA